MANVTMVSDDERKGWFCQIIKYLRRYGMMMERQWRIGGRVIGKESEKFKPSFSFAFIEGLNIED